MMLLAAAMPALASAQVLQKASERLELATVETEIGECETAELEVFQMHDSGTYWLSVGQLTARRLCTRHLHYQGRFRFPVIQP